MAPRKRLHWAELRRHRARAGCKQLPASGLSIASSSVLTLPQDRSQALTGRSRALSLFLYCETRMVSYF